MTTRALVPIGDAQQELGGIGRTTLYSLIKAGHLAHVNIGRRAFITGDSIAAYIASITNRD
ncbi:helix-turn-helix domain-containing protein [Mycolicibacterium porcinum]|uniref:helix-turn-helix domain-containing protein n=1 Tax=Mycolicibacterium porcinum TaxID=39693 RepID=UPI000848B2A5|nr:helix-turn-helix domain-containing protein [Mycolicibacterium porcinum]ODR20790.1 hypothetical protein BHQ19_22130 [Mycolicibacterium porcinum]